MIVSNFDEMRRYLPAANVKMPADFFDDILSVAQDSLQEEILGEDLIERLEKNSRSDARLLTLCRRAIALEAFLRSIPRLDIVITEAGFGIVSNQDIAPASRERIEALKDSIRSELDSAKDRLVGFLLASKNYEDWRCTKQFTELTDGLFVTFSDFREHAPYNKRTAELFPASWSEFRRLGTALNIALTADIAAYISPEYALALIEKIRDDEMLLPSERKALSIIKRAVAAVALGDRDTGVAEAIKAAAFMKANLTDFPTFAISDAAQDLSLVHEESPIYSMF